MEVVMYYYFNSSELNRFCTHAVHMFTTNWKDYAKMRFTPEIALYNSTVIILILRKRKKIIRLWPYVRLD